VPSANFHTQGGAGSSRNTTDQTTDIDLGTYIYLTGFTLGHDYEWSMEWIQRSIGALSVAPRPTRQTVRGFNYGFGLRFPIQTQLKYHNVVHPNQTSEANLTAAFEPINGSAQQFASTGLESDQILTARSWLPRSALMPASITICR